MLSFQVQILIFLASVLGQQAAPAQLPDVCGRELTFKDQQPITIQNSRTSSPTDNLENCRITINGSVKASVVAFMIQINLYANKNITGDEPTSMSIIDHGLDHLSLDNSILNQTSITELDKFIRVKSTCFEISFFDRNGRFNDLDSIIIAAIPQAVTTTSTTAKSSYTNSTSGQLPEQLEVPDKNEPSNKMKYFIGFIVCVVLTTAAIFGVWTYRKRRLKWTEFLAQLDNNTDWEYEQLDDYQHSSGTGAGGSMPTMSPIFDMSIAKKENKILESGNVNINANDRLSERESSLANNNNQSYLY